MNVGDSNPFLLFEDTCGIITAQQESSPEATLGTNQGWESSELSVTLCSAQPNEFFDCLTNTPSQYGGNTLEATAFPAQGCQGCRLSLTFQNPQPLPHATEISQACHRMGMMGFLDLAITGRRTRKPSITYLSPQITRGKLLLPL